MGEGYKRQFTVCTQCTSLLLFKLIIRAQKIIDIREFKLHVYGKRQI